ncbi:MAG: DUF4097 family beta strand repeat-containing protein, partial [Draconibacterium sp.]|nr:DUF4097 family beta strand repeat-containing protein [Draconibacterium sp.]
MRRLKMIWYFVFTCWLMPNLAIAQFTETKEMTKHFKVTPETQIEISNKYGKVEINTWDKDSVVIEIKIRVEEKKLSKLEQSIKNIDFNITDSQHYLIVRTDVEKNKTGLGREITRFKESLLSSDGNIQVDYTVWMPDKNELKVENKFGDIFIGDYLGEVEINLSNGNLKAHDFEGDLSLILNFADATINSVAKGRLDCNFSELYVKKAESLRIKSKSTDFEFGELKDLNAESRRDKFRIRIADLVDARSSFTNFRINELTDRLNIRSEYGDIEVEETAQDFSNINIESKSTDINLYFNESSNFNFEIIHTKSD